MHDETWMDGKGCLALGFADRSSSLQAMACIHSNALRILKNADSIRNLITPRVTVPLLPAAEAKPAPTAPENTLDAAAIRAQVVAEQRPV